MQYPRIKVVEPKPVVDPGVIEVDRSRLVVAKQSEVLPMRLWRIGGGEVENSSYLLSDEYDWVIVLDDHNRKCLVPLKKEKQP